MLYIGIDLGTSAVKLLLMDEEGQIKNEISREYPLEFPQPGWSQQNPEDWKAAVLEGVPALLDINNSVPKYIYDEDIAGKFDYDIKDTFMVHCGNTPSCKMCDGCAVKYQLIQNRLLENGGTPDFTRGTLEGDIAPGEITFYRLQCDSEGDLRSYIAQGEVLPVATRSFGGIGIFAIPEMGRFYRHVLIQKRYPHHGAVAFAHCGKALFEVLKYFGVSDIAYNQPKSLPYPTENPLQ